VLLFFTRPLSFLPDAVLAAIVFLIGIKLVDFRGLAEIRRSKPTKFAVVLVTAVTVVLLGVKQGIIVAAGGGATSNEDYFDGCGHLHAVISGLSMPCWYA
jgi:MFS superfamily sulfate permease-like transporter